MSDAVGNEPLRHAKATIADAFLGPRLGFAPLGEITLRPHQEHAVARLLPLLRRDGGALLADATGLGKTYVALAIAREFRRALVIAPASLRATWARAIERAAIDAQIISMERLSRQSSKGPAAESHDLVVIDEAHHFRTTSSRRYAAAVALCRRTPVLLLSATPLQNRRRDLSALLALFLGSAAWSLTDAEQARWVVRRDGSVAGAALPALDGPHRLAIPEEDDWLDALLALPPPTMGSDQGDGGALVVYSLVRQWASSRAAFLAGLRRRLARASAMGAALESGRHPSRRELAAWTFADDVLQLAFPELLAVGVPTLPTHLADLRRAVLRHEAALRTLLADVRASPDPDLARTALIRELRRSHTGERIIAFSQFTETVHAIGAMLRRDGGVAELTSSGARVAGGRITRREVLAQLSPEARHISAAERIELLVTTDVLSEGLDLQQASVIVHLDLPWNPARLEQRVGRVRRLGSSRARVSVYVCAPPVAAERLLRVEQRLRDKLGIAGRVIGPVGMVLPGDGRIGLHRSEAEINAALTELLEGWRDQIGSANAARRNASVAVAPLVVILRARTRGFIAVLRDGAVNSLLASGADGASTDTAQLLEVIECVKAATFPCDSADSPLHARELAFALGSIARWWDTHRAAAALDVGAMRAARTRRRIVERIATALASVPRHRRAELSGAIAAAQEVVRLPLSASAEQALAALATAPIADEQWLLGLATFSELHRRAGHEESRPAHVSLNPDVAALVLLVPGADAPDV